MCLGVIAIVALPAGAARAAVNPDKTTISFVAPTAVTAGFGGDWSLRIHVTSQYSPVGAEDGTVDVTVAGVSGTYASDLPISGNGDVYLSPPDGATPLSAGTHQLTAFFRPDAGSNMAASHSAKAAVLTVSALTAVAGVTVSGVDALEPTARLALTGTWNTTTKTAPPGTWKVEVTAPDSKIAFSATVLQPTSSTDPIVVPISSKLARGTDYRVTTTFVPDAAVASGLTLTQAKPTSFHTPDLEVAEVLSQPIDTKPAILVLAAAIPVGLLVAVILVSRNSRRRRARATSSDVEADGSSTSESGSL